MRKTKFQLVSEVLGYSSAPDPTNIDIRYLVAPSQNVLVNFQRKVSSRGGYTRLGAANAALTPVRNAWTWNTSTGTELPQRFYDDELEVYLDSIDGVAINAWTRIKDSWNTTNILRPATWFDATENIDLQLMIIGDTSIYEWSGAIAVVDSIPDATHVKKVGSTTWAQNRFYTTRNKIAVCVRTGTTYTYSAGESSDTLTVGSSTGLIAGDILVQQVVQQGSKPTSTRINDTILVFENQLILGSFSDDLVYISENDDYIDFSYSSPRVAGEGGLLTLDGPSSGLASIGKILVAFAGRNSIFRAEYQEITVGTTLAETLKVKKLDAGVDQCPLTPEVLIPIGDALAYLTHDPTLRIIQNPDELQGLNPTSYSNPIKPDFDAEDFTSACGRWFKNTLYLSAPVNSHVYMLVTTEDADGKKRRYWQPPQLLPVRAFSVIDEDLYGHSNAVPETYKLFDGYSDGQFDGMAVVDKLPIHAIAAFAYNNYGERSWEKNFDEYFVEGEISPSTTDLVLTLNYNFGGFSQSIQETIDGTNEDILEATLLAASLGQQSLATQPFGGVTNAPTNTAKFRTIFELAREDFFEMQAIFSTNEADRFWSILAHGPNAVISRRHATQIKQ